MVVFIINDTIRVVVCVISKFVGVGLKEVFVIVRVIILVNELVFAVKPFSCGCFFENVMSHNARACLAYPSVRFHMDP